MLVTYKVLGFCHSFNLPGHTYDIRERELHYVGNITALLSFDLRLDDVSAEESRLDVGQRSRRFGEAADSGRYISHLSLSQQLSLERVCIMLVLPAHDNAYLDRWHTSM